jgi:hypothetical protein
MIFITYKTTTRLWFFFVFCSWIINEFLMSYIVLSSSLQTMYSINCVSTQENYPWFGTDKKLFLCVNVISSNPNKEKLSCPFQSTDNFPEWKLALRPISTKENFPRKENFVKYDWATQIFRRKKILKLKFLKF